MHAGANCFFLLVHSEKQFDLSGAVRPNGAILRDPETSGGPAMNSRSLTFVLALFLLPSVAAAQLAHGELRGTVVDESGGVLPGVNVTAVQVETGTSRAAVSASNGTFLMPAMPLGTYKVTAELSGFGTIVREGFRLGVGETVTINFTMKVAAI